MLIVEVWIPDVLGGIAGGLVPVGRDAAAAAAAADATAAAAAGAIAPFEPDSGSAFRSTILKLAWKIKAIQSTNAYREVVAVRCKRL